MTADERPALWVGHIHITVGDAERAHDFYVGLGMRSVWRGDSISITELRGGTHLILKAAATEPSDAGFDLMVDDLAGLHASFVERGLPVSAITGNEIHDTFTITDPDGNRVRVLSSHVVGPV